MDLTMAFLPVVSFVFIIFITIALVVTTRWVSRYSTTRQAAGH